MNTFFRAVFEWLQKQTKTSFLKYPVIIAGIIVWIFLSYINLYKYGTLQFEEPIEWQMNSLDKILTSQRNEQMKEALDQMKVFETIEDIEKAAIERKINNRIEIVSIEKNTYLSDDWDMDRVKAFYEKSKGQCTNFTEETLTCVREINSKEGKFKMIIAFQQENKKIKIVQFGSMRTK